MNIKPIDIVFIIFFGMILGGLLLILLGDTPKQVDDAWKKDAIAHGYAQWAISTNTDEPTVVFQWK
jgi:hypothetical protein